MQKNNSVATVGNQFFVMCDDKNGFSLLFQKIQKLCCLCHMIIIQTTGWLIQYDKIFVRKYGRCNGNALLLPTGQLKNTSVQKLSKVKFFCAFPDSLLNIAGRYSHIFTGKCQFCCGVHVKVLCFRILKHTACKRNILFD